MSKKPYFCDECGTRNTPDSKYCKECGAQIIVAYQSQALSEYDKIDDPTDQERLSQFIDMAFWHNEAGNFEAALRACQAALALNASSTTALSLLGSIYEKQGDDAQAIAYFEKVLQLNPDSAADRAKLEQLQGGIHVKPLRASPVYRWLPPVFGTARFSDWVLTVRERWQDRRRPEMPLLPAKATPALAAGVAAIVVISISLFLIKPPSQGAANTVTVVAPSRSPSLYADAQPAATSAPAAGMPKPLVMMPSTPGVPLTPRPSVVASVPSTDPFAGNIPTAMSRQEYDRETGQKTAATPHNSTDAYGHLRPLPPLVAVPQGDAGPLPPAPVSAPQSIGANAPISANSDIARHTVVVSHLSGLSEFDNPGQNAGGYTGGPAQAGVSQEPPSRIQITVDPATTPAASSGSGSSGSSSPSSQTGNATAGEDAQQSAFALQQQGNYTQAAAEYQKAIASYQAQISTGSDRDAATRGLLACQTGLQICRQSQ